MKPHIYRNGLSKALQSPRNYDPSHGARLTNREVWAFSELSMLMWNQRANGLVASFKQNCTDGHITEELMHYFPWMGTGNVCMIPKVLLLSVGRLIYADRLAQTMATP